MYGDETLKAHMKQGVMEKDYNTERVTVPYESMKYRARWIGDCCVDYGVYQFARAMAVLEIAGEGRTVSRVWGLSSEIAFDTGDIEFCREFAIRNARDGYSKKQYNPIKRESADENVVDIMGMITDELGELEDDDYDELLEDFGVLLSQWRALKVPKYKEADAYETMYEIQTPNALIALMTAAQRFSKNGLKKRLNFLMKMNR